MKIIEYINEAVLLIIIIVSICIIAGALQQ